MAICLNHAFDRLEAYHTVSVAIDRYYFTTSCVGWLGSSHEERVASPQALSVWGLVARMTRHSTPATQMPKLFLSRS
jgi:hypothetical protein